MSDAHVRIIVLEGADNAPALLDAKLLQQLGFPLFVLLDHTSTEFVEELGRGRLRPGGTKEEKVHAALAVALANEDLDLQHVPLEVPDIVWTLPEDAVKAVAPNFPGWEQATAYLRGHKGKINPKDLLRDRYQFRVTIPSIGGVIAIAQERGLGPGAALKGAIASIVGSADGTAALADSSEVLS